jgi:hypothetical protein
MDNEPVSALLREKERYNNEEECKGALCTKEVDFVS